MRTRNRNTANEPVGAVVVAEHQTPSDRLALAATDEALLYCGFFPPEAIRRRLAAGARECLDESAADSANWRS